MIAIIDMPRPPTIPPMAPPVAASEFPRRANRYRCMAHNWTGYLPGVIVRLDVEALTPAQTERHAVDLRRGALVYIPEGQS